MFLKRKGVGRDPVWMGSSLTLDKDEWSSEKAGKD